MALVARPRFILRMIAVLAFSADALAQGAPPMPPAAIPTEPKPRTLQQSKPPSASKRATSPKSTAKPALTQPQAPNAPAPAARMSPPAPTPPVQGPTPKPLSPEQPIDTSKPPPSLPRASRERMRACADEWSAMKRKTRTGLPMWRDFATECLTR